MVTQIVIKSSLGVESLWPATDALGPISCCVHLDIDVPKSSMSPQWFTFFGYDFPLLFPRCYFAMANI
jgi:hypothetical protein